MPKKPGQIPLENLMQRITLRGTTHVYTNFAAGRLKEACKLCESLGHGRSGVKFGCPACGIPFHLECFYAYHVGVTLSEIRNLKHIPH